jgi:cytochrome c peroxidase
VKDMGTYQLGKDLKDDEVKSIVAWLKTLTGELPMAYIAEPKLPAGSKTTPKPGK